MAKRLIAAIEDSNFLYPPSQGCGVPQIEVNPFWIWKKNANVFLNVSAKDKGTEKSRKSTKINASGPFLRRIEANEAEAEANARHQIRSKEKKLPNKNQADSLCPDWESRWKE